ncbi:MAG TPA: M56 family metallopeptidase, partial [Pirellulales bacterium]
MSMSMVSLVTGWQLYWGSVALGSLGACGAALLARWLLRKRSAPVKHALLLAGLYATALAPVLLFGALVLGHGWRLHVERPWIEIASATPRFVRATTAEPSPEPVAATQIAKMPEAAAQPAARPEVGAPAALESKSPTAASWMSRLTEFQVKRQPDGRTIVDQPLLPRLLGLVVFAWWIGTLVGLVRLAWGTRVLRRLKRTLIAPADPRIAATLAACLGEARVRRRVEIRESAAAPAPLSFGLWRPTIVLPAHMATRLDDEQLRLVVAHEVAHVVRRDHRVALVERLTSAAFWWNPLVRAVNRGLSSEREQICDDYAAATPGERRRLAEVLVLIAEWSAAAPLRIGGATALVDDARDDLATRVTRLVENKPRAMRVTLRAALGLAAFAVAVGGVVLFSALRAAPYERFQATPAQTAIINELRPRDFLIIEGILGFQVGTTGFHASNEDVARLAELGNIDELSLGGEDLTEDCLVSIGRMDSLRNLSLSFPFTTAALKHVARLPNLEELSVSSPSLADDGLLILAELPKLGTLRLNGTSVSDAGLQTLAEFPSLVSVNINNNRLRITDVALAGIARCPRLTQLAISSDGIKDTGLQSLARCRSLTAVDLQGAGFTDDGLSTVASLPNLRMLTLQSDRLTGAGLRHLQAAAGLEWLRLRDCPLITNDSLAAVGELTQLFRLSLQSKVLTDAGLAHLKNLTGLWELEIDGPKFTGDGLKYLVACQNITEIRAQGERIDDSIFVPLNEFSKLRQIVVGAGQPTNRLSGVTNAGLAKLKSPSLQIAMFARTAITNDGLVALDALPNLSIAHFPFSSDVNPPIWTRGTQRVNRPPRHGVAGVRDATPRLPPLGDAQVVANDALIAELKKTFGP